MNILSPDGVVIIDDHGVIRQVMVSSMEVKDLSANVVSLVGLLRKHKVSERRRRLRRAAVVQLK